MNRELSHILYLLMLSLDGLQGRLPCAFASRLLRPLSRSAVVVARAGDGWMEDECDNDPFDDPFGDALHVSSGLQTTPDSSANDDESVGGAETSIAPARVRKAMFHVLDEAKTIDGMKDVEKETTDDEGTRFSVSYRVNYSGEVHNVSGLETLEDCALDRDHTQVKCSCALGRNGQVCAPKMKAMLMENELWTFKALGIQCKPDDVERTEFDVDVPMIQDDVEAFQPTHRRSLGAAFDDMSVKSRWAQQTTDLTQVALDPEFTFEPEEAAHITDTLNKLERYMHNLKTHREMSQSMSKNSKMDGDGVIGMSNLVAIPMRGAAGDTALSRKRGWHEKMVDEHKRKASKGEQISIRNYLS